MRWNYYKLRQLSLLQSAMDFTNCDSFFITKCDTVYYKLRQVLQSAMIITNCDSTKGLTKFIPYNEVSISYVLLLFIIGVKKIVLYIEDFVQLKFHCKCLSFTVRYPPRQAGVIKR